MLSEVNRYEFSLGWIEGGNTGDHPGGNGTKTVNWKWLIAEWKVFRKVCVFERWWVGIVGVRWRLRRMGVRTWMCGGREGVGG